ncbi:MAG: holo-ACP synthase, partial [Roseiflexaceae bacterium]
SGPDAVSFCHIEVVRTQSGKPTVVLHQRAQLIAQRLYLSSMDVSMSHDGEYAVASVVALGQVPDEATP